MLQHPRFKPHLHAEVVEGEGLFLLAEQFQTVLQGRLYEIVAPWLDGRSVEAVCRQLAGQASPAQVFYTLKQLEQDGYLCEGEVALPSEGDSFWALVGIDPPTLGRRLAETAIEVRALGVDDIEPLRSLLGSMQIRLAEKGDLRVVVTDSYLRQELQSHNQEALRSGRPWLLLKPVGGVVWVGPLFRPGKTGCWECLAERFRGNSPVLGYIDGIRGEDVCRAMGRSRTPAGLAVAWGLAAQAVAAWVAGGGELPLLDGKVQTLDLFTWKSESHTLVRHPCCPACGSRPQAVDRSIRPLVLESRTKVFTEDGGHRALSPQETLDRYGYHVSPICGAVTALERSAPAGDGVMHVYSSGNNSARSPRSLAHLKSDLRSSTCGKGTTDLQARASALCEGLERYCGIFRGDEPRRLARMADLGDAAVHPNACMLFSERQYREREARNARGGLFSYIPLPFDREREIEWTPVWSLTQQAVRYLPTDFCYYNYPADADTDFCTSCSNGCAAGNCLEEAILQGFLELVERDSVSLWWHNRVRVPGVDFDSFNEPYLGRLKEFLKTRGRDLWALDLTSDLGIPAFAAVSRRTDTPVEQIMFGFGAHLEPRVALLRAVTELNQMLVHLPETSADDLSKHLTDEVTLQWLRTATLANQPYLLPREGEARTLSSYPRFWTEDLKEDILVAQGRVEEIGLEMLVLDQTRPEVGMPVVKVMVPGLRHFWPRFAPGRLYDVPVKQGWLREPLAEEQMNPVPMFL